MSTSAQSPSPSEAGDGIDLAWLLSPTRVGEFLDGYWESRPLHVRRDTAGHYDRVFAHADLDRLLSLAEMSAPVVDVVEKGRARDEEKELNASFGSRELDSLYGAYARGSTLKWRYLDNKWRPLARLCQSLESALSGGLGAEMYLTPPRSQSFAAHFDRYHFFVLQIEGTKHWRVYGEPFPFPRAAHAVAPPAGQREVTATFDLEPGDLLYMPRGYYHDAHTTSRASLSIHVGVNVYTWFDALRAALESVEEADPVFRKALPAGFTRDGAVDAGGMRETFGALLRTYAERASFDDAMARLAERFTYASHQPLDGFFDGVTAVDRIVPTTVLRKRQLASHLVVDAQAVTLVLPQRRIKAPRHVEAALRFVLANDEIAVESLPGLTDDAKVVLARRLVREGFLTLAGE